MTFPAFVSSPGVVRGCRRQIVAGVLGAVEMRLKALVLGERRVQNDWSMEWKRLELSRIEMKLRMVDA